MPDWNTLPHVPYLVALLGGTAFQRTHQVIALMEAARLQLTQRNRTVRGVFARPMSSDVLAGWQERCTLTTAATLAGTLRFLRHADAAVLAVDGIASLADAQAFCEALSAARIGAIASFDKAALVKRALERTGWVPPADGRCREGCRVDGVTGAEGPLILRD